MKKKTEKKKHVGKFKQYKIELEIEFKDNINGSDFIIFLNDFDNFINLMSWTASGSGNTNGLYYIISFDNLKDRIKAKQKSLTNEDVNILKDWVNNNNLCKKITKCKLVNIWEKL